MSSYMIQPNTTADAATGGNPFKGPLPLSVGDPIFGRDNEIRELLSLLVARRIVLLHAVSGCGKTSLVEAGVRPRLAESGLRGLPTIRFRHVPDEDTPESRHSNPLTAAAIRSLNADQGGTSSPPPTMEAALQSIQMDRADGETTFDCLIFDQFEDVLSTPRVTDAQRLEFFKELGLFLDARSRWAIFAIRDDYLGALEPYKRWVPTQFAARMRLAQLPWAEARTAILETSKKSVLPFAPDGADRMASELAGPDGTVEPVYLQIACQYVWNAARRDGKPAITTKDVTLPGAAAHRDADAEAVSASPVEIALREYYDEAILMTASSLDAQRRIRQWCSGLIEATSSGGRRRQSLWTDGAGLRAPELEALESRYLVRKEHRNGTWVELAHDRLIRPILESNTIWQRQFKQPWQEAAERWRASGRSPASPLLIADEGELAGARQWAEEHEPWISEHDDNFLQLSAEQARNRQRLREKDEQLHKVARRVSFLAAAVVCVAVLIALGAGYFIWQAGQRIQAASAREDEAERATDEAREVVAAAEVERQIAGRVKETALREQAVAVQQMKDANRERDAAKQQTASAIRAAERARAEAAEVAADATAKASAAREQAAQATADANATRQKALDEVAEANRRVAETERIVEQKEVLSDAQDLTASSVRTARFEHAVSAFQKVLEAGEQGRDVLRQTLRILNEQFSRGLLLSSLKTKRFIQAVGLWNTRQGPAYVTHDGLIMTCSVPAPTGKPLGRSDLSDCKEATPPVNTGDFGFPSASGFSPDANRVALGTALGRVRVLDRTGQVRDPYKHQLHEIVAMSLSQSGRYLVASSWLWNFSVRDLSQWPAGQSRPKRVYELPASGIRGWFRYLRIFQGGSTQVVRSLAVFESSEAKAGGLVAIGRQNASIEVYRLLKPERVMAVPGPLDRPAAGSIDHAGHTKPVLAVAFDHQGRLLASGGQDGKIFVWNVPTDRARVERPEHLAGPSCQDGSTQALAFSPDDTILAAGCQDGSIRLIDVASLGGQPAAGAVIETLTGRVGDVRNLVFDPAKRRLFASGSERLMEQWYVPTREEWANRSRLLKEIREVETLSTRGALPVGRLKRLLKDLEALKVPGSVDSWDAPAPR